jgi:hypothetical protein
MTTAPKPDHFYIRPGHTFRHVIDADAGRCTYCAKPIVYIMCSNGSTYIPVGYTQSLNDYTTHVHADGSAGHGVNDGYLVLPAARCPKCKGYDVDSRQEAYGDRTWCNAPGCGWNHWYDIGD